MKLSQTCIPCDVMWSGTPSRFFGFRSGLVTRQHTSVCAHLCIHSQKLTRMYRVKIGQASRQSILINLSN